jgi:DNA-nicking Smr family endonuclease
MKKRRKPTPVADDAMKALYRAPGKGKRRLSAAELKLWQQVADSVEPLADRPAPPPPLADAPSPAPVGPTTAPGARKPPEKTAPPRPQPATPPKAKPHELTHGETAGIDRRTAGRFKKGKMAIDGRLDLHGHSQREAHVALKRFILDAFDRGKRCVLVVTGKGRRSQPDSPWRDRGTGVLRESVPRWLNEPGLRAKVLSFSHAAPADGGEGALYVLLKRKRGE